MKFAVLSFARIFYIPLIALGNYAAFPKPIDYAEGNTPLSAF
jgi:hypothetical protein